MPAASGPTAVLIGAGDISQCSLTGAQLTGALMSRLLGSGAVTPITLGDNSNDSGSKEQFDCFDRGWGRFRGSLMPTPGNHDYETDQANPYYDYFGANAGVRGLGYYAYDRGAWHIVVLNSELPEAQRNAQFNWLEADLRQNTADCTVAYLHRPLFSSGEFAAFRMRRFWTILHRLGVDLVLNGHEHFFAAFPPLNPDGIPDPDFGIRQLVIGTGGARLFQTPAPNYGERIVGGTWGVLKLTLSPNAYAWDFISVDDAVLDSGTGQCHGRPPGP